MAGKHWNEGNLPDPATQDWVQQQLDEIPDTFGAGFDLITPYDVGSKWMGTSGSLLYTVSDGELLFQGGSSLVRSFPPMAGWEGVPSWDKLKELHVRALIRRVSGNSDTETLSFYVGPDATSNFGVQLDGDGTWFSTTTSESGLSFTVERQQPYTIGEFHEFNLHYQRGESLRFTFGEHVILSGGTPYTAEYSTPVSIRVPFFGFGAVTDPLGIGEVRCLLVPLEEE